ncbi:hypothetical protein KP803_01195 [Vibrio sp. ZSDE26]|uniref:Uncharacterized protein n=1 Tax=Vibrio amylolyticus TaxID=2847292 RepID=A0A9X1XFA6_9VIBR|nr:hypothetical protein [Vibrio amylolyticus]MCK6261884.1 hypothetical protein [Vibrio amylolyticus]
MSWVRRTFQMSAGVLVTLLALFGVVWSTLIATLIIAALIAWFNKHISMQTEENLDQSALGSTYRVFLPKLNKQLQKSYQDSNQSINQITLLFSQLALLVKQRNTLTDDHKTEEKQVIEQQMNAAYNELLEQLQHGDRNLQRQAGVMEGIELLIEQLRLVEQGRKSWDESSLASEFSRITNRTELAMAEKKNNSQSDDGITYF